MFHTSQPFSDADELDATFRMLEGDDVALRRRLSTASILADHRARVDRSRSADSSRTTRRASSRTQEEGQR